MRRGLRRPSARRDGGKRRTAAAVPHPQEEPERQPGPPARALPGARGRTEPRRAAGGPGTPRASAVAAGSWTQLRPASAFNHRLPGGAGRATFPTHVCGVAARAAAGAPAGCPCGGAGSPAALRAANKAASRRKRLARGLLFTPVEISRGQSLPASLKMGFPERPNEKPGHDQLGGTGGNTAGPRGVSFREQKYGGREREKRKKKVPLVPPAATATPRPVLAEGRGKRRAAPPHLPPPPPPAAPRLPLVCTRLIRSGNSFPFL